MAAPTLVQSTSNADALPISVTSLSATLSGVTAGNTLICMFGILAGSRPCTINDATNGAGKDSQNNSWTTSGPISSLSNGFTVYVGYSVNVVGGTTTLRWLQNSASTFSGHMTLMEWSPCTYVQEGSHNTATGAGPYYCANAPGLDTGANCLLIGCGVGTVSRTITHTASWTRLQASVETAVNGFTVHQYFTSNTALTDQTGQWTTNGNISSAGLLLEFVTSGEAPPTDARISQASIEIGVLSDVPIVAKLSQVSIEIAVLPSMAVERVEFFIV